MPVSSAANYLACRGRREQKVILETSQNAVLQLSQPVLIAIDVRLAARKDAWWFHLQRCLAKHRVEKMATTCLSKEEANPHQCRQISITSIHDQTQCLLPTAHWKK